MKEKMLKMLSLKCLKHISLLFIFLFISLLPADLHAKEYFLEDWQCYVDMPQGLDPLAMTTTKATFGNSKENVFSRLKSTRQMHINLQMKYSGVLKISLRQKAEAMPLIITVMILFLQI